MAKEWAIQITIGVGEQWSVYSLGGLFLKWYLQGEMEPDNLVSDQNLQVWI